MNDKPDYSALDANIIAAISRGCSTFGAIQDAPEMRNATGAIRDFRMIDRRLQALRRAGKIKFERHNDNTIKQWMLA